MHNCWNNFQLQPIYTWNLFWAKRPLQNKVEIPIKSRVIPGNQSLGLHTILDLIIQTEAYHHGLFWYIQLQTEKLNNIIKSRNIFNLGGIPDNELGGIPNSIQIPQTHY